MMPDAPRRIQHFLQPHPSGLIPMSEPVIELSKALALALTTALATPVERRYAPYMDPEQLRTPRWILAVGGDDTDNPRRHLVDGELTIDIALQAAHPDRETRDEANIDTDWCDARVEDLGRFKDLFRPGGSMRDQRLANCDFRRYENTPLYRPDLLLENLLFVGVVRLIYHFEHNDD